MSFAPSSPVTGATITGLTSPTYTLTADVAPSPNGKQYAVTALGGTQTGVDINTVSKPFTHTFFRPEVLRPLPQANPVTGVIKAVPVNSYKLITRKGAVPASGQNPLICRITTTIDVFSGTETYEAEEINAMLSSHIGIMSQQADGIANTVKTGIL